jgi:hypothetical protein
MLDTPISGTPHKLHRFRAEALGRGIPSADVDRWLGLARRCAALSPEEDGPVVGRLGGPVMLPPDVPVPAESFESLGRSYYLPHHLIATLDLAALPEGATGLPMPPDGHLLLFAIPELDGAFGAVVYIPAGTTVEERRVEYDYEPDDYLASLDFDNELTGELRLKHDVSLPDHTLLGNEVTVDTAEHPHARELLELWPDIRYGDQTVHQGSRLQIGGYAMDTCGWGDPIVECARWAQEDEDGLGAESGEESQLRDHVLVAQWQPGMTNLDMATMYWVIRRQDMATGRFDRASFAMYANP